MLLPEFHRCRASLPFSITGEERDEHIPWHDDFCLACGDDLRVSRTMVTDVSIVDAAILHLCEAAWRADEGGRVDIPIERQIPCPADRQKLVDLYLEGLVPVGVRMVCGFHDCELVGITVDGAFLYMRPFLTNEELGRNSAQRTTAAVAEFTF